MKMYSVDFGSWIVEAESEEDAKRNAQEMIEQGEMPPIDNVVEID